MEVNLTPSMNCSTPLDLRVKSSMLSDVLNIVGIPIRAAPLKVDSNDFTAAIEQSLEEYHRRGNFRLLYPSPSSDKYNKFFVVPRPLNTELKKQLFG
jgi:hypothetical protein